MVPRLLTKRLGAWWWIVGDEDAGPMGPYHTKAEADDDRRGLLRTYRDDPDIYSLDQKKGKK